MGSWVLPIILLLCGYAVRSAPDADRITDPLPNLKGTVNFTQYAGYLPISDVKQLFYWYVESQGDPANDPVLLWLNGGPGCSSLQGLLLELGPFRVSDYGKTVTLNKYSWNKFANIIFLDAPAGVGFSVRTDGLWNFTDTEVAADNLAALRQWFTKFPERKANDFYIAGESYAGTYIPMLAALLINNKADFANFKGMFVGNGCLNDKILFNTGIQYAYYHALIDERLYQDAVTQCCANMPPGHECDFYTMALGDDSDPCSETANNLSTEEFFAGLDPYFIYYTCYLDGNPVSSTNNARDVMIRTLNKKFKRPIKAADEDPTLPACAHYDDYNIWLNLTELRTALHIPDTVPAYSNCNNKISDQYITEFDDMTNHVKQVVDDGSVKVMFFNGDMDSICNVQHNAQFLANLGYPLLSKSQPWKDVRQKPPTIGMYTKYQGVDFLTVRGAGHFSSSDMEKPKESLQLFYNYIHGLDYSQSLPGDTDDTASSSSSTSTSTTTSTSSGTTPSSTSSSSSSSTTTFTTTSTSSGTTPSSTSSASSSSSSTTPTTTASSTTSTTAQRNDNTSPSSSTSTTHPPTTSESSQVSLTLCTGTLMALHLLLQ